MTNDSIEWLLLSTKAAMTKKPYVPPRRLVDETDEEYKEREEIYYHIYISDSRDNRRHYDDDGNIVPADTGAERQRSYELKQSKGDKKRPGWWLSDEVIKAIASRQWNSTCHDYRSNSKSDRIDGVLRYMLRVVEAVEAKVKETGRMPEEEALALVLEKIVALEVPYIPPFTEEEIKAQRLEMLKSMPPTAQRAYVRHFGNPDD